MNKLFTLFLLLSIIATAQAWKTKKKPTPTPAILKQYPFTMTDAEYNKIAQSGRSLTTTYDNYLWLPKVFIGYKAHLCILRKRGQKGITKIFIRIPLNTEKTQRRYIQQFEKIKQLLIKKYGPSTSNKYEYNKNVNKWELKKYRKKMNSKELAFYDEKSKYISTWKRDKFTIELKCYKKKYVLPNRTHGAFIDLSYIAPKVKPAVKVVSNTKKTDPLAEL